GDVRRVPVLDEKQTASRPQHAADFPQGAPRVRDGTRRPSHDEFVNAPLGKRNDFGRGGDELERDANSIDPTPRESPKLTRRIEPVKSLDGGAVEGKVEARAEAHLQHAPACERYQACAFGSVALLPHDEVDQAWKDVARVDPHALTHAVRARRGREPHRWTCLAWSLGSARAPSASRRSPG